MSKNIVIQQKGVAQNITASRITTPELDGGSCTWVPEDETQLEEITVTENGEYTPSGYGFSKVTVDVAEPAEPVMGELIATANGTYNPTDYGYDAFSGVKVNVHGEGATYTRIYFYSEPLVPFFEGGTVDLTGVEIHAVKSDSTEVDVTSQCTFDPPEGWEIPIGLKNFPLMAIWHPGGNA